MKPSGWFAAIAFAFTLFLGLSGCNCGGADVLECVGSCSCDDSSRTCTCNGGTLCTVEGAEDITFVCEGNASCDLECGVGCHIECPGTSGCTAVLGDESTAVCNGSGFCDIECDGDCAVDCPGSEMCVLDCPVDATCEITSCEGEIVDCGNGVLACRASCPAQV